MSSFDVVTIGRVSMDLFSRQHGADFAEIRSFDAMIGGSPSNIAIGSARLGMKTAVVTAVGPDDIGRFVVAGFAREGVDTRWIPVKEGTRTGVAFLGVEPPDRFPLTFYRDNPADIHLTIDDVLAAPVTDTKALVLSGTALARGSCAEATIAAAAAARRNGVTTYLDLDLRPDQWADPEGYGRAIRAILADIEVVIGTEEEFWSALSGTDRPSNMALTPQHRSEAEELVQQIASTVVLKRGSRGVAIIATETVDVPGFPVEVVNTVGAGDGFAAGLVSARTAGLSWAEAARFANACGALVVSRHGCSVALPTRDEVEVFLASVS